MSNVAVASPMNSGVTHVTWKLYHEKYEELRMLCPICSILICGALKLSKKKQKQKHNLFVSKKT